MNEPGARTVVPPLPRLTGRAAGYARLAYLAGACVVGAARVELSHRLGGRRRAQETFRAISREFCQIFGVAVEIEGELDPLAREVRVANHTTYLDILVLNAVGAGRFLSMREVASWPLVGLVAKHIGTVFVERGSREGRAQGLRALERAAMDDEAVVVFPEGKTSDRGLLPFARGAFQAARHAGIAVRPVAVVWDDRREAGWVGDATLMPHVIGRLSGRTVRCVVRVLPPIAMHGQVAEHVAVETRRQIAEALGEAAGDEPEMGSPE